MTGQQRVPDLPEVIGGRYRVLENLGQGGMGRVVKVEHQHTGELLAMKLVLSHRVSDPLMVQRFRREARAMARVRSEYVVRVTDADTCEELNGAPYLVMELLDGEDLGQYARRRGRLGASEVVGILEMVARGLTAVHKANLVHRDLKPQNIFLHRQDDRVVAKLLDFGLAKCVEGEDALATITQTGAVVGTSYYLSPEQVLGQTELISRATDVWAIGILAFRLLTGRHYWNFSALARGVLDIGSVELTPPSGLDESLPLAFDAWFFRSCDRDPAKRWPDAQAQWKSLAVALKVRDASWRPLPSPPEEDSEPPETRDEPNQAVGRTTAWSPDPKSSGSRDRRQVTVLYYRLVHTDRRTPEMDPEDFASLHRRLRSELEDVLGEVRQTRPEAELEGQFVFFGYPVAYGDDARRAVEAGLRILEAAHALDARLRADGHGSLAVRVGIHTGVVLAGTSEGPTEVVGPALAVATEFEHQAALGQLVVGASTWRLLAGRFRGTPLNPEEADSPFLVLGRSELPETQVEPGPPMVGRQAELQLLLSCLEQAQSGQSQMALVTGEAGIGKSRFVQAFREAGAVPESSWLECCCSPYFRRTPFHPLTGVAHAIVRDASGRSPGAVSGADVASALQALQLDPSLAPFLESLLSLPSSDPGALEQLSPQLRRQRTVEAMIALLHGRALAGQLVLVVEDLHWADPSSLALLDRLSMLEHAPLLTLLTARPEFRPTWSSPDSIAPLQLRRLSPAQTSELIGRIAGEGLDAEAAEALSRKTDGIPLFIEQLTRLVLEAARQAASSPDAPPHRQVNLLQLDAAPNTLRESLTARLDLLGPARELAQLASALGQEIDVEELRPLWSEAPARFDVHLGELVRAKVLQPRGLPPHTRYAFQHALLREAAYDLLPRQARRDVHGRIAQTLLRRAEERAVPLELLAHHLAEAGRTVEAAGFLLRAGQAALERSANEEARGHFLRGLDLLRQLPKLPEEGATLEVTLRTLTGMTWVVSRGYGVPEVEEAFAGAMAAARAHRLEDSPAILPALWAHWMFALVRGRFAEALGQSERLLALAGRGHDPGAAMLGHLARGTSLHGLGRFAEALEDLEAGIARYDPEAHGSYRYVYGQDPLMFGRVFLAWGLWCTGYPDRAATLVDEAVAHARRLRHPNSLGFALAISAIIRQYRGEAKPLADSARTLLELSTEQGWLHWMGHARLWGGAAQVMEGRVHEGITAMREARALAEQGGERSGAPHYEAVLIDGLLRGGLLDEARQRLSQAMRNLHLTGELAFVAELLWLEGELAKGRGDYDRARGLFAKAAEAAATRGSRSYELRAVGSLVRLERLAGADGREAIARLTRLVGAFSEGFDTADLRAARQELGA